MAYSLLPDFKGEIFDLETNGVQAYKNQI